MLDDSFKLSGKQVGQAQAVAEAVVNEIVNERATRGINFPKNWDMYNAKHSQYFKPRMNEDAQVFQYRKDNPVVVNLVKFTVDLASRYLYGRAQKVFRRFSEKQDTNKRMLDLAKQADIQGFLLDASKKAAIFGEVTARIVAVDALTGLQPDGKSTQTTYPQPILLDPMNTFVKRNRWNKIVAVVMRYKVQDYATNKTKQITELVVEDSRWIWSDEAQVATPGQALNLVGATLTGGTGEKQPNTYRLSDEFVHLPNNQERLSDIEDIMDLNISLDEAQTDKKHFFSKHGWPQLLTEVSLEDVQYSPNKIWEIKVDDDSNKKVTDRLGFLTWDGKMEDHAKFVKNLERQIMILSNTAAISTGDLEAIGQLRSGAALITAHSVAIHKTQAKQIIWERNEINLFRAMANFDSYLQQTKVESRYAGLDITIVFPKDFVPGAEHERAQINQIMFNSHLKPLRAILREENPFADDALIEEMYQEIMKDSVDVVDSTREFVSEQQGATGKSGTPMQKSKQQTPK
jgi:hypothetical protein